MLYITVIECKTLYGLYIPHTALPDATKATTKATMNEIHVTKDRGIGTSHIIWWRIWATGCKVLLPVSSLVMHKIYCATLGNVARVYPWIIQGLIFLAALICVTKILARVVQVDALLLSVSKLVTSAL